MSEDNKLFGRFRNREDVACEAEAIALGQQGETGLQNLQRLLATDDTDLRFWAVRGLWANGSRQAIKLLIETLTDQDKMVRSGAALALGELKAGNAIDALARLLTTDTTASGDHAADALAKIGLPSAPALIEAMEHGDTQVRRRAARALIPIESREAIRVLFEALEDESYIVRHYAELALEKMGVGQMVYFQP